MDSSVAWIDMEMRKGLYQRNDELRTGKHDVNGSNKMCVQQNTLESEHFSLSAKYHFSASS